MTANLVSRNPKLVELSGFVNATNLGSLGKTYPIARVVDATDIPVPPAPAWYHPASNNIYIHINEAGITASKINPKHLDSLDPKKMSKDTAKMVGLFAHEVAHADISGGMEVAENQAVETGKKSLLGTMTMLEEVRVEAHVIRRNPRLRPALRSSFTLILDNIAANPPESEGAAARAWALVRGRTLAGIASHEETDSFDIAARTILGDDRIDQMIELLQEAIQVNLPKHADRMIEIAEEWNELVGTDEDNDGGCNGDKNGAPTSASESSDDAGGGEPSDGESESGEGEESQSGEGDQPSTGDADESGDDGDSDPSDSTSGDYGQEGAGESNPLSAEDAGELIDAVTKELREIMDTEWNTAERRHDLANANEWAARVFGSKPKGVRELDPTAENRQHVVKVAQFLSNVTVPTISKTSKALPMPPGRLRTREGVRRSAERSQGMMVTAKPWKGTVRRHSAAKPLVIGIATDTSGSMKWAEQGVAEFAYVYANAGHRIGARTAAVTFGDDVHLIARPGEVATQVRRKTANGGTEECDHALASLDGVLHLTDPSVAAKILIVVSDGALVKTHETGKVTEWLHRLDKAGTHVIWVSDSKPHDGYWITNLAKKLPNVSFVTTGGRRYDDDVFGKLDKVVRKAITDYINT